jgi:hypothetical protein
MLRASSRKTPPSTMTRAVSIKAMARRLRMSALVGFKRQTNRNKSEGDEPRKNARSALGVPKFLPSFLTSVNKLSRRAARAVLAIWLYHPKRNAT